MKKVLFIANHRLNRSPGQRFRFEQYLNHLESNGFQCTLSNIIDEKDDRHLYQEGKLIHKGLIALKSWNIRWKDIKSIKDFDIVFVYREALLTSSTFFEKKIFKSNVKMIFDFDDAIWIPNVSEGNKRLSKLKKPTKTNDILQYADLVFAGNNYLATYAKKYNSNVVVVPTTIDTNYHKPKVKENPKPIVLGWTGTQTTLKYLKNMEEVFVRLKNKYRDQIQFQIICDREWSTKKVDVDFVEWNKDKEISQLQNIDIGLMPLIDDEWSRGKCGFKGLQYMALEIPSILSPVGVNKEIIKHGVNGYLANDSEEWESILSSLIENEKLRREIGKEARKTVEEKYSVNAIKDKYLEYFKQLTNQ